MKIKKRVYNAARWCRKIVRRFINPIKKNVLFCVLKLYSVKKVEKVFDGGRELPNPFKILEFDYAETDKKTIDLSLIIPVYNAELYLEKCLESIINQNTKYDYEVILINDGSVDNSKDIIGRYCCYDTVRYFEQDNHGIAYTRNRGVELSRGKYIGFIDNDDYLEIDYVEKLLNRAYTMDADVVKCGHEMLLKDGNAVLFCQDDASYKQEFLEHVTEYNGYIWGGISKKTLWEDISFPEGFWYEDMTTRFFLYLRARSFEYIGEVLYHKLEHETNASRTIWSNSNIKCLDQVYLADCIIQKCKNINVPFNVAFLKSILREYGTILYERCRGKYLREAFRIASYSLRENIELIEYSNMDLTKQEDYLLKALVSNNYGYYKIVLEYLRCS